MTPENKITALGQAMQMCIERNLSIKATPLYSCNGSKLSGKYGFFVDRIAITPSGVRKVGLAITIGNGSSLLACIENGYRNIIHNATRPRDEHD